MMSTLLTLIFGSCSNILTFFFAWRIYRHLSRLALTHSGSNAHSLNRQLSTALLLQAVSPVLIEFVPMLALGLTKSLGNVLPADVTNSVTAMICWTTVLNPLSTIWVIRAYRNRLKALFCGNRHSRQVILMLETTALPSAFK